MRLMPNGIGRSRDSFNCHGIENPRVLGSIPRLATTY
jgi:hypothetical protein